jgi:precorrin-6B methylase 2
MKNFPYKILLFAVVIFFSHSSYSQDVPYVPTPYEVVDAMLEMADVKKGDVVYDLGSGDGRIVVTAAKKYGVKAVGVDSNPTRIEESHANAKENGVTDLVEFHQQNLFETDLSEATVVTIYLMSSVNLKLRPKLFEELNPGVRLVSNSFDMDEWEPDASQNVSGRTIYFWRIPENVSGTWEAKAGNENYVININQKFQKVEGSVKIGDTEYALVDPKLNGNNLNFTVNRNKDGSSGEWRYTGKLKDDQLNGSFASDGGKKIELTANRREGTKKHLDPSVIN